MASALYTALEAGGKTKRERLEQLRGAYWTDRSPWDAYWQELADYLSPTRVRFQASQRNQRSVRNDKIIDSTALFAVRTLQSGLHAGLTSPARPWFNLTTPDPELAEHKPVKEWLHIVTQRLRVVLADSNIYTTLPTVYGDLGVFGTAAMAVLEDSEDLFRAEAYPLGSYAFGLDARGIVGTFIRDYQLSVLQVVERFGLHPNGRDLDWRRISPTVRELFEQGNYTAPVPVCWVVTKNYGADPTKLGAQYLPWSSCHFEQGQNSATVLLRESGFQSFPVMAPRWDVIPEDTYGVYSPGMVALGDSKQLQGEQREKGKAIAKLVSPPMVASPELRTQKTSTIAGDITYVRDTQHGFRAAHELNLNLAHLTGDIAEVQDRIDRAFYVDLFRMITRSDAQRGAQPITAREIDERHEEKMLALGPTLERSNDELLGRIIDRAFLLLERAQQIPPAPEELQGVKLKVEYVSILAAAQKSLGVAQQERFITSIAPVIEADPSLRFKVDGARFIDNAADMTGVDPRLVRSTEEATAMAREEAKQAQAMAEAQRASLLAKAGRDAASAPLAGGGSVLDRLVTTGAPETVQ